MLSALLPGVREFRTPLVSGILWAACVWLLVGHRVGESETLTSFVVKFHLDALPTPALIAGATFLVYLVGSLLVVRWSPFSWVERPVRVWAQTKVERLDLGEHPKRRRYRLAWRIWQGHLYWRGLESLRRSFGLGTAEDPVDYWLRNRFSALFDSGRVPVMRSFDGTVGGQSGFLGFYTRDSVEMSRGTPVGEDEHSGTLEDGFVAEIKGEKPAIEVRIQMRFPDAYSEIDRLKAEAELRSSIFWPVSILSLLLTWTLSPFALVMIPVAFLMVRDAFQRTKQADAKTWSALIAGEVSSPSLDAMANAKESECEDFRERYRPFTDEDGHRRPMGC